MRPRRDPVPRAKEAWWWLGGILTLGLVGGGIVVAGIALWENIDIRQLAPSLQEAPEIAPDPAMPRASAGTAAGFSAVLFESPSNRDYFEDADFYGAQLQRWRELTEVVGGEVRAVTDAAGLRDVAPDELLLLPEAPCISSNELAAINRHLDNGGSVVANWALGVRDGSCEWRGWQVLTDVTGAEAIRELTERPALYFTVPGGLPTSPGIDAGSRVELRPDPAIALRMPGPRIYWSDWALNPTPDPEGVGADVAVATTRTDGGGRVTWFGVRTDQGATPADSAKLVRVFENGIRWGAGVPHAAPAPWPDAARTALVFAMDVEGEDASVNARDAAAMFELEGLPISFYVVSGLVQDDEVLANALHSVGEVGTQTVDHTPLVGLTRQDQTIRLRRSWNDIERWTGEGPAGLRPPEESVDAGTLEAWSRVGGTYVLASNEARSASPEIHETEYGPVVLLPRLLKDDYTVIVRDVTLRSQRLADAFVAGARKMRAIGGLAVVAGHTQIIAPGPRLEAVRTVADSVRAQGEWWLAEGREVADWWLARSRLELAWESTDSGDAAALTRTLAADGLERVLDHDLLVSWSGVAAEVDEDEATAATAVSGVWIDVVAPTLPAGSLPLVDGTSVDFIEEEWGMRVAVGAIASGEVKRVSFVTQGGDETEDGAPDAG
ncbi:MAG: polysaccharide deacetylase family protein [Gemmatimonadetes bacterium]|nr:polysaccharide deacetylase family protein [Gemmatimonadota bacterium]